MSGFKEQAGAYMADVHYASRSAGFYTLAVAFGWIAFPFAVETAFMHPEDAIKAQLAWQGLPVPHAFTAQQIGVGFAEAIVALGVLVLVQLVCTVMFYRKAQMQGASVATPVLWPLAAWPEVTKRRDFPHKRTKHELRQPCERYRASLSGGSPSRFSLAGRLALPIQRHQQGGRPAAPSG
jgi:hypothetical protein